jgi:hypothetical protein
MKAPPFGGWTELGRSGDGSEAERDGPLPPKPRYMRWRAYRRLERLEARLESVGWEAMSAHVYAIRRRTR